MPSRERFSSYYADSNPRLRRDVPEYQSNIPGCFSCGSELHYSSGFKRRCCDTCGFIEGDFDAPQYPRVVTLKEYCFLTKELSRQYRDFQLTYHEYSEALYSVTFYDSYYRPPGEGV
jgi:hypothetical protein